MLKTINVTFLICYCSLIFWLSSRSSLPATPMFFEHQDKIHHLGAYFIMGILAWRVFNDYFDQTIKTLLISLCFCSLFGLTDEWHQSFVSERVADVFDWIADTIGALMAVSMMHLRGIKVKRLAG